MKKNTATLIHTWKHKETVYRLVAVGKYSKGYEDEYVIEQGGEDSLGHPCWIGTHWEGLDQHSLALMASAIKSAQAASVSVNPKAEVRVYGALPPRGAGPAVPVADECSCYDLGKSTDCLIHGL